MYSTHIYNSLLINVSVSLIVSEVLPHMTEAPDLISDICIGIHGVEHG